MTWTGIRIRGMDHLNNFESEEILWNPRQGMNPRRYLFEKKRRGSTGKLSKLKKREIYPHG